MATLLQWNLGLYSHLEEFQQVIANPNPNYIYLPETRYTKSQIQKKKL